MEKNKIVENMSLWKIILITHAIYKIVSLPSYDLNKTNIFIGSLVLVFALVLYSVFEYFLGKRS